MSRDYESLQPYDLRFYLIIFLWYYKCAQTTSVSKTLCLGGWLVIYCQTLFLCLFHSCVDDSGHWGRGGMFDALSKLSASIPDAYQRASEFGDLHLGDLHLIRVYG